MRTTAFLLTMLVRAVVSAQQTPSTGTAPVNGRKMYYEVHGSGEAFVTGMTTSLQIGPGDIIV